MATRDGEARKGGRRFGRWALGFVAVVALVEGGHAAWSAYDGSAGSDRAAAESGRRWANLKRCLLGDAAPDARGASEPLARLRRGLELTQPDEVTAEDSSFPQRCAMHAAALAETLDADGRWVFLEQLERVRESLDAGQVHEDLDLLWLSLDDSLPVLEPDASTPLPPKLPTELVPLVAVTSLGDESIDHTIRRGDTSNGGPLTVRFETTRRTCVFARDLRTARCLFDPEEIPDTRFQWPGVGSPEDGGSPWLSHNATDGATLYDLSTGEALYRAKQDRFAHRVVAANGVHWVVELDPKKQLLRRDDEGEVEAWPLPNATKDARIVGGFLLTIESVGETGRELVARRLPDGDVGLGAKDRITDRLPLSFSRWYARRSGDDLYMVVDGLLKQRIVVSHRDGKWATIEVDGLPDHALPSYDAESVHFTWVEGTYVQVMTCRAAGCQKTSYRASLGDENAAVRIGKQLALLSWDDGGVSLSMSEPEMLAAAPRRRVLSAKYLSGVRLWARGDRALALLDADAGALPIAFDATGDVWPVRIEDGADLGE